MKRESRGFVMPMRGEVRLGTLAGLLRQAEISADEFIQALRG